MTELTAARRVRSMVSAAGWLGVVGVVTVVLVLLRSSLDKAHVVLAYLIVVLFGSSVRGRQIGLLLAVASFLAFNFFLLPPFHTLAIADRRDWLILGAYLVTCLTAAELFQRAQAQAEAAAMRAAEVEHLAALGAETLNAGRAEDGVLSVARVMRATLNVAECSVYGVSDNDIELLCAAVDPGIERNAAASDIEHVRMAGLGGTPMAQNLDGTWRVFNSDEELVEQATATESALLIMLPLLVRDRLVGVLRLFDANGITLNSHERRFARALAYYAALGVDRVHMVREAQEVEALKAADRAKDALLASVSHDLRAPLTTIKAIAHELRRGGDENAAIIETEADRLNEFVADLLDLSRINGGALRLRVEPNAADDLLSSALDRLSGHPRAAELKAHLVGSELLLGQFDFSHSLRALVNLIENALKYSPAGSIVTVTVRREGAFLLFEVSDKGQGIPATHEKDIFTEFFRAPGTEPDSGGAGLGLAIARKLAVAQGGDVVYARNAHAGSCFTLLLPALDTPPFA